MQTKKTDTQIIGEYVPKIKAFTDTPMFYENAGRIYDFLKPYHYDTDGWRLRDAAKTLLDVDVYSAFPAEDNLGYFENLDGFGFTRYMEIAKFATKEYEQIPGGYELMKYYEMQTESPEYQEYRKALFPSTVLNIIDSLTNRQPYLLPGFWARLSNMENIIQNGMLSKDDLNDILDSEVNSLTAAAKKKADGEKYSEYEVKSAIRDALYVTPFMDEQIQALADVPNILDEAYDFYLGLGKDGEFHNAAFEYLFKAEYDYIGKKLFERVKAEYGEYIDGVKMLPPKQIIEKAHELAAISDILCTLDPETCNYDTEQLKGILSLESPLLKIYHEWQSHHITHIDDIVDIVRNVGDEWTNEIEEISFETDSHEDEEEQDVEF